jgi:hypothetical protein
MLLEKAGGKGPEAERARAVVSASNPAMPAKDPFRRRRR